MHVARCSEGTCVALVDTRLQVLMLLADSRRHAAQRRVQALLVVERGVAAQGACRVRACSARSPNASRPLPACGHRRPVQDPLRAHAIMSRQVDNAPPLAVSIETRARARNTPPSKASSSSTNHPCNGREHDVVRLRITTWRADLPRPAEVHTGARGPGVAAAKQSLGH